ncbi:MAG: stage III sporulation protein AA [Desulfitobacteriia bacterium]|jgi:stage III sporulation protein AA
MIDKGLSVLTFQKEGSHSHAKTEREFSRWLSTRAARMLGEGIRLLSPTERIEEIRLRINQPLTIRTAKKDYFIPSGSRNSTEKFDVLRKEDLLETLDKMTYSSIYAAEEELKQGFITLPGGHRTGICGETVIENGKIKTLKNISALNIRLARQPDLKTSKLLIHLLKRSKDFCHTLLISPPRAGKTTLLRQLIRDLSNGVPEIGLEGQTVGVVDERSEIAGMWQGISAFDLGCRTDVLDRCPKALGIKMLIRSMAPSVVAVDELGGPEDIAAVREAMSCGVKILATLHANSVAELKNRKHLKEMLESEILERVVVLSRVRGPGTIEAVYDSSLKVDLRSGGRNPQFY